MVPWHGAKSGAALKAATGFARLAMGLSLRRLQAGTAARITFGAAISSTRSAVFGMVRRYLGSLAQARGAPWAARQNRSFHRFAGRGTNPPSVTHCKRRFGLCTDPCHQPCVGSTRDICANALTDPVQGRSHPCRPALEPQPKARAMRLRLMNRRQESGPPTACRPPAVLRGTRRSSTPGRPWPVEKIGHGHAIRKAPAGPVPLRQPQYRLARDARPSADQRVLTLIELI